MKTAPTIEHSSPCPGMKTLVSVTVPGRHGRSDYWAEQIPCDFGLGVRFDKIWAKNDFADGHYDVLLDTATGHHTCECKGFLRHSHCRHIKAALMLLAAGAFAKKAPRPEEAVEMPGKASPSEPDYGDVFASLPQRDRDVILRLARSEREVRAMAANCVANAAQAFDTI